MSTEVDEALVTKIDEASVTKIDEAKTDGSGNFSS